VTGEFAARRIRLCECGDSGCKCPGLREFAQSEGRRCQSLGGQPLKQALAQQDFELLDSHRNGRLGDVQAACGRSRAAVFRDCQETSNVTQ